MRNNVHTDTDKGKSRASFGFWAKHNILQTNFKPLPQTPPDLCTINLTITELT